MCQIIIKEDFLMLSLFVYRTVWYTVLYIRMVSYRSIPYRVYRSRTTLIIIQYRYSTEDVPGPVR